jgi:hypothetical protein
MLKERLRFFMIELLFRNMEQIKIEWKKVYSID